MGNSGSNTGEKEQSAKFAEGEFYVGFENRNAITCYANSVVQSLYYCEPFRRRVLEYRSTDSVSDNPVLLLQDIFNQIQNYKKKNGCLTTKKLMNYVKDKNEMFRGDMHQDAHEFLNWFLNEMNDTLQKKDKKKDAMSPSPVPTPKNKRKTWLEEIFEGVVTSQTKCFNCETITERDEPFLDLSIDLEQNTSITYCIKSFSNPEILKDNDKFHCDKCKGLQDAEKKIMIKSLPNTLIVHMKRFKYDDQMKRLVKLNYKVAFPSDIRIEANKEAGSYKYYDLYGVVIHIGPGLHYGHYIVAIKHKDKWILFDDDQTSLLDERALNNFFGHTTHTKEAYLLFYQAMIEEKESRGPQNANFDAKL